jgi:hypothetical protein
MFVAIVLSLSANTPTSSTPIPTRTSTPSTDRPMINGFFDFFGGGGVYG